MESKKIKKGDFIELDYTGKLKEDGSVFDTTNKDIAAKSELNKDAKYEPIVICVGEGYVLSAIESGLEGKSIGKYSFELTPEQGFGKKSAQLLKLIPMKVFRQQEIMPYNGLEVNVDNSFGIVRNVSGGRIIVDFNHPLSGRDLVYDVEVIKFVTDDKERLESILKVASIHYDSVSVKEKNAMIVLEHDVPEEVKKAIDEKAKSMIGLKKTSYVVKKQEKKPESK